MTEKSKSYGLTPSFRFDSEPQALFTSVICLEEIRFGAKSGPPGNKLWERMESDVWPHLSVLALSQPSAILAGDLRADWKALSRPVGYRDGLIAATVKAHGWSW